MPPPIAIAVIKKSIVSYLSRIATNCIIAIKKCIATHCLLRFKFKLFFDLTAVSRNILFLIA
jgi:hypothetical protein